MMSDGERGTCARFSRREMGGNFVILRWNWSSDYSSELRFVFPFAVLPSKRKWGTRVDVVLSRAERRDQRRGREKMRARGGGGGRKRSISLGFTRHGNGLVLETKGRLQWSCFIKQVTSYTMTCWVNNVYSDEIWIIFYIFMMHLSQFSVIIKLTWPIMITAYLIWKHKTLTSGRIHGLRSEEQLNSHTHTLLSNSPFSLYYLIFHVRSCVWCLLLWGCERHRPRLTSPSSLWIDVVSRPSWDLCYEYTYLSRV